MVCIGIAGLIFTALEYRNKQKNNPPLSWELGGLSCLPCQSALKRSSLHCC